MLATASPRCVALIVLSLSFIAGCQALNDAGVPGLTGFLNTETAVKEEEQHRQKYQESRDSAELGWLLRNRIQSGMSPAEVSKVFGDDGERVRDDEWVKNEGGYYQVGDEVWKWGPARDGKSVFLVFRERQLVNFDPHEFDAEAGF